MDLQTLNALPVEGATRELARCCGASKWVARMLAGRPYANKEALLSAADRHWRAASEADWREAFTHHPRIGDREVLRAKFAAPAGNKGWESEEQKGVQAATDSVLDALAAGNAAYEDKFGYIFLVCATGKSAEEMLALLEARLKSDPASEIKTAAAEQEKITRLRLEKLLT